MSSPTLAQDRAKRRNEHVYKYLSRDFSSDIIIKSHTYQLDFQFFVALYPFYVKYGMYRLALLVVIDTVQDVDIPRIRTLLGNHNATNLQTYLKGLAQAGLISYKQVKRKRYYSTTLAGKRLLLEINDALEQFTKRYSPDSEPVASHTSTPPTI